MLSRIGFDTCLGYGKKGGPTVSDELKEHCFQNPFKAEFCS
jgi:hypothetical protein